MSRLAAPCPGFEKEKGRRFVIAKKSDEFVHMSQKGSLGDARPPGKRPPGVNPEAWPRFEAVHSAVRLMNFMMHESISTLITNNILYLKEDQWYELQK